jgi:predicted transcriptional regulator
MPTGLLRKPDRSDCILSVYMAATTTIRVSPDTRDRLRELSARRNRSAGETIAELVRTADDDLLLADAQAGFQRMAADRRLLAAYHSEARRIGEAFDAPPPDW